MKGLICETCGHIAFDNAPDKCPVCGSPKTAFTEKDAIKTIEDEGPKEKHVPVIQVNKECNLVGAGCIDIHVRIGETLHPMEPEHHIRWIDLYVDKKWVIRTLLTADCQPAASAHIKASSGKITVIEFCNLHGHWINEQVL